MGVYSGGVPEPGKNLYPSSESAGEMFSPDNGPQDASYTKSGPPTFDKSNGGTQVIDTSGYDPEGEERADGMKVIDLNDISDSASSSGQLAK